MMKHYFELCPSLFKRRRFTFGEIEDDKNFYRILTDLLNADRNRGAID